MSKGGVIQWVLNLVHRCSRRVGAFHPGVATCPAVSWRDDQLFGSGIADCINSRLIIGKHETSWHIIRLFNISYHFSPRSPIGGPKGDTHLIHQAKDNLRVIHKPSSEFSPEGSKLRRRCSFLITGVTDHAPSHWLL
jgi:hypothetical protein